MTNRERKVSDENIDNLIDINCVRQTSEFDVGDDVEFNKSNLSNENISDKNLNQELINNNCNEYDDKIYEWVKE